MAILLSLIPCSESDGTRHWRYRWSSQSAYLGKPSPVKVESEAVLSQFSSRVGSAREAYQRFVQEGLKQGHDESYYQTIDQRFLGEESFIENVAEKAEGKEIQIKGRKVSFVRLLQAVSAVHGVAAKAIVQAGRQRQWVGVRAQLVYLARQSCDLTTKELGRRLNRDASMISRLYGWYDTHRDERGEKRIADLLAK